MASYRLARRSKHRNKTMRRRPTSGGKKKVVRKLRYPSTAGAAAFNIWSQWNATRSGRARLLTRKKRFTIPPSRFYGY